MNRQFYFGLEKSFWQVDVTCLSNISANLTWRCEGLFWTKIIFHGQLASLAVIDAVLYGNSSDIYFAKISRPTRDSNRTA